MKAKDSFIDLELLAAAVIQNAFQVSFSGDSMEKNRRSATKREARSWIESKESERAFSFCWCCEILGLNADWLRQVIKREWKKVSYNKHRYHRNKI